MSIIQAMQEGRYQGIVLLFEKICMIIPDKIYLKMIYRIRLGKKLNLKNPKTYNEKLQWLKLYDRKPIYTDLVDKAKVKGYVASKIGAEHVIPLLGVWDSFDEINFDELPERFILKCNHDSGSFAICKDKATFDKEAAKKKLNRALKRSYYWSGREWPYKNVERKIIAEEYIDSLGKPNSIEYKMLCNNGRMDCTTICGGIAHSKLSARTNDFYDRDFKPLPFWSFYRHSEHPATEKPACLDEIIEYCEILAEGIPHVRIDFYEVEGQVYFGEMTFFTWGGFNKFVPEEWDEIIGGYIELPKEKTR